MTDLLLILGCLAVLAGAVALVVASGKLRARRLKQAGVALGLKAVARGEHLALPSVELLRKKGRRLGAALVGEWHGVPVIVFDLLHPSGKSYSRQTVVKVRHEKLLPEFALVERDPLKHLPSIDLPPAENAPAELKRFWYVHARDGAWTFHEPLTRWLEPRAKTPLFTSRWSYEGVGSRLIVYRRGQRASVKHLGEWLDAALAEAQGFCEQANGLLADDGTTEIPLSIDDVEAGSLRVEMSVNVRSRRP